MTSPRFITRGVCAAVDQPVVGDKPDTFIALVVDMPGLPIRVPLSRSEAEHLFRAIGSML